METIELTIKNDIGLHARPAALFVQTANQFKSKINMLHKGQRVNAKSILGVLTLGVGQGSIIQVEAEGPDSSAALEKLQKLVDEEFLE